MNATSGCCGCIIAHMMRTPATFGFGAFLAALLAGGVVRADDAAVHYNMGLQLKRQGKTPEALVEMKNAVQLRPDYAAAWFTLGTLYRMEGELDNAAQALLKVT